MFDHIIILTAACVWLWETGSVGGLLFLLSISHLIVDVYRV